MNEMRKLMEAISLSEDSHDLPTTQEVRDVMIRYTKSIFTNKSKAGGNIRRVKAYLPADEQRADTLVAELEALAGKENVKVTPGAFDGFRARGWPGVIVKARMADDASLEEADHGGQLTTSYEEIVEFLATIMFDRAMGGAAMPEPREEAYTLAELFGLDHDDLDNAVELAYEKKREEYQASYEE